jgi:hypothetical protein
MTLMLVCKLWKAIIENFFFDTIHFPYNIDTNIVKKYDATQLIGIHDKKLTDVKLKVLHNLTYLTLYLNNDIT